MTNYFENNPPNFSDPSRIRNFLRDADNDSQRKQYGTVFHLLYALLCAAAVYLAASGGLSGILLYVAPAACVFTFLYSPVKIKLIPVLVPLAALAVRVIAGGSGFIASASVMFTFLLCILTAAFMAKAVISGYTKSVLLVTVSVIFGTMSFCQLMFSYIAEYGTFSFSMLMGNIDKGFELFISQTVEQAKAPETLELLKSLSANGKTLSEDELLKLAKSSAELTAEVIKPLLPSIFALACMFYGFVSVAVFSLFAKYFRMNVFTCIMDKDWTYRPSVVSAMMYDAAFLAFIIGMFVNLSRSLSVTIINLLVVLTPLMFGMGLRAIYTPIYKKSNSKAKAVSFTAIILIIASAIIGEFAILIIASVGVSFIGARNREERLTVQIKYLSDLSLYNKRYTDEQPEQTQTETPTESEDP